MTGRDGLSLRNTVAMRSDSRAFCVERTRKEEDLRGQKCFQSSRPREVVGVVFCKAHECVIGACRLKAFSSCT